MKNWFLLLLLLLVHSGLKAQLSGTYTINPNKKDSGTNYISIYEATQDLMNGYRSYSGVTKNGPGVSGPVIFNIANGTINNFQVTITTIKGASSKNTITFQSASGDSSKTIFNYPGGTVFTLKGAQYINIKNITIQSVSSYGSSAFIALENGAGNINISNCRFTGYSYTSGALIINTTDVDSSILINNNLFKYYSTAINGITTNNATPGLYNPTITNNVFDSGATAIYLFNSYSPSITNNTITSNYPGTTGIQLGSAIGGLSISKNNVNADNGIIVNSTLFKSGSGNIYNNMIISITTALAVSNSKNLDVFYNSCTNNKSPNY